MTVFAENGLNQAEWATTVAGRELLVVNLMPEKAVAERQFLTLLAATGVDCRVTFAYPASHRFRFGDEGAIHKAYLPLPRAKERTYDGLIVTGAPVEHLPFAAVDYWAEFRQLVAWSRGGVARALFECWACQAALQVSYGLSKVALAAKRFGVYSARLQPVASPFLNGFAAGGVIRMPQSRHSQTTTATVPAGLEVLARSATGEALLLASADQHDLYITGHPEYGLTTLDSEYQRDRRLGRPIQPPVNYYRAGRIVNSWQASSIRLYRNWLCARKGISDDHSRPNH